MRLFSARHQNVSYFANLLGRLFVSELLNCLEEVIRGPASHLSLTTSRGRIKLEAEEKKS